MSAVALGCVVAGFVSGVLSIGLPLGVIIVRALERADDAHDELRAVREALDRHGFDAPGTSPAILVERVFEDLAPDPFK